MSRKKVIAANWKMYKTPEQTTAFFQNFSLVADHARDEIVVCPPFHRFANRRGCSEGLQRRHRRSKRSLGQGRRVHRWEISVPMLNAIGVTCDPRTPERRQYFNETDDSVNRKLEFARRRTYSHRLREKYWKSAKPVDRRRPAPAVYAGVQWHLGEEGN